jgi:hypothetical protein
VLVLFCLSMYLCWCCFYYLGICAGVVLFIEVFVLVLFFLSRYLCWFCFVYLGICAGVVLSI